MKLNDCTHSGTIWETLAGKLSLKNQEGEEEEEEEEEDDDDDEAEEEEEKVGEEGG